MTMIPMCLTAYGRKGGTARLLRRSGQPIAVPSQQQSRVWEKDHDDFHQAGRRATAVH